MDSAVAISHLDDLELAVLVCLVAKEHCIIRAPQGLLPTIRRKLQSIVKDVFDLTAVCIECGPATDVAELKEHATKNAATGAGEEGLRNEGRGSESRSFEDDVNVR
jgi:hypothetical protein